MFDFTSAALSTVAPSALGHSTHPLATMGFAALRILPDTAVTITIPASGFFERLGTIASAILALAVLFLSIGLLVAAWYFRATYKKLDTLIDRLSMNSAPLLQNAAVVADDVRDITGSIKRNVRAVEKTIDAANDELLGAVRNTGARIEQFNALLDVVQDEAASAFVATASTVRGVGTGLAAAFRSTDGVRDDDDDYDADADEYDDFDDFDDEGEELADPDAPSNAPSAGMPRAKGMNGGPRVRPKRGMIDEAEG